MPPRDEPHTLAVPFCDLAALNRELRPQLDAAYRRVIDKGRYVLGDEVSTFEGEWAAYCGKRYAVGVGNGMDAITLMLRAYGIGEGHEVIVPAHTCFATWAAVAAAGARPVAVDVDESMLIDVDLTAGAVTDRTRAILAVHLYGRPCQMVALRSIADSTGVRLLVDAAQAHGLSDVLLGDAAAFSFYPTKNLGALGDGGAVVTDNTGIANQVALLRNYGSIVKDCHELPGSNSRLDELQAAFLRAKLPFLDRFNARRFSNATRYGLQAGGVNHQCVALVPDRVEFRRRLLDRGIETMVHYPTPPHLQPAFRHLGYAGGMFPVAERIAREVVSIPCGPELSPDQVDLVAEWARP